MSDPTRTRSTPGPTWADFELAALGGRRVVEPAVELAGDDVASRAASDRGELTREGRDVRDETETTR